MNKTLYDQDYYLWLEHTTQLLKQGKFSGVDIPNLIDEIEGMGKSQKQALKSNLRVVLMHLLKYQYQPEKRSNSWKYSIREHRNCLHDQFEDSPSLKRDFNDVFQQCYANAREEAADETGLSIDTFPIESPFLPEQSLNTEYLPS
ncbi:MAG: DUF29 domain-containing protein [Cyanobacteria bacterium QH_10_48_56]|nr:MAG: DUF29 domain-containing protein [Cyanobacteria bacterium QH_10_48_56]